MALSNDNDNDQETTPIGSRTVSSALALLRSLKPQLDAVVAESGGDTTDTSIPVVFDRMDIMRRVKAPPADSESDQVWADVMYLAPRETGDNGTKLRRVCGAFLCAFSLFKYSNILIPTTTLPDLVHTTF